MNTTTKTVGVVINPDFKFEEKKASVQYKHIFNETELIELGDTINKQIREKSQLELEKKSAMSTFKSKIEIKDAEINITSNYLNDKYKYETVESIKRVNLAEKTFEYIHPDTGEVIQVELMRTEDLRKVLPKYKDIETKNMVWYNPIDGKIIDSRPLNAEELQLTIEEQEKGN